MTGFAIKELIKIEVNRIILYESVCIMSDFTVLHYVSCYSGTKLLTNVFSIMLIAMIILDYNKSTQISIRVKH